MSFTSPLPGQISYTLKLLESFDKSIWTVIVVSILLNYILQIVFRHGKHGLHRIGWTFLTLLLGQPFNYKRVKWLWTLIGSWLISAMILRFHYSASVCTSMTLPQELDVIETLDKLASAQKSGRVQAIMLEGTIYAPDNNVTQFIWFYAIFAKFIFPNLISTKFIYQKSFFSTHRGLYNFTVTPASEGYTKNTPNTHY